MKRVLTICAMLITMVVTAFAQKTIDFSTYDVVAKAGDVPIIVKDNDYRMVVGPVKKPKINMLMGYSKEQAASKIDRMLDFTNEKYTREKRNVSVCGVMFILSIKGAGDNEKFLFEATDHKGSFTLAKKDMLYFKESLE